MLQEILEFGGVHAGRERAADQAAHAGPGDQVNRDAVFLEPLDHADVRDATGAAAAERHAHDRPLMVLRRGGNRARHAQQKYKEPFRHPRAMVAQFIPWSNCRFSIER